MRVWVKNGHVRSTASVISVETAITGRVTISNRVATTTSMPRLAIALLIAPRPSPTPAPGCVLPDSEGREKTFGVRPPSSCLVPSGFCWETTESGASGGRRGANSRGLCKNGRLQVDGWLRNEGTIDGGERSAGLDHVEPGLDPGSPRPSDHLPAIGVAQEFDHDVGH